MVRQADDSFVYFGAKPDKGFGLEISDATGSRQGNASQRVVQRNSEKAVGYGRRRVADEVDTGQQRDQSDEIGSSSSEGRPVKMGWHS